MEYNRVNWKKYPDRSTPINADNLNTMDEGIYDVVNIVNSNTSDITSIQTQLSSNTTQINKLTPVALYNQDTLATGTITLLDSVSNYFCIEVYFRTPEYQRFVNKLIVPDTRKLGISCVDFNPTTKVTVLRATTATFNGNEMEFGSYMQKVINEDNTISSSTKDNNLYVYYVLGYKNALQ